MLARVCFRIRACVRACVSVCLRMQAMCVWIFERGGCRWVYILISTPLLSSPAKGCFSPFIVRELYIQRGRANRSPL